MAMTPMALSINNPQIDTVGAYQASQANTINADGARMTQEAAALQQLAEIGYGVMGNSLDGEIDPQRFEQALGMLSGNPLADKLRGNPELLRTITRGSLEVLQSAQSQDQFEMAKKKFEVDLAQAESAAMAPPDAPKTEEFYDEATGQTYKAQWNSATNSWEKVGGLKAVSPGQTINVGPNGEEYGDPGAGLVWQRGPDGKVVMDDRGAPIAIPFQGGKPYADMKAAETAGTSKDANKETKANIVVEDADRALQKIKDDPFWTTGLMAGWLTQFGGTPAADVNRLIDTIRSNTGFAELQAMREASPTGGALGQVTERELQFLQSVLGSLAQDQSAPQLEFNLKRVKEAFLDIIHGPGNRPDEGGGSAPAPAATDDGVVDFTDYF